MCICFTFQSLTMSRKRRFPSISFSNSKPPLPTLGNSNVGTASKPTQYKPTKNEFLELLINAFKAKISSIIRTNANSTNRKNSNDIKTAEWNRKKVPPGTFEELETLHCGYWTGNTCKRLHINALGNKKSSLIKNYHKHIKGAREGEKIGREDTIYQNSKGKNGH